MSYILFDVGAHHGEDSLKNDHGFEIVRRESNDIWSNEINFYFKKK